ncbi:DUF6924 domain-containing protein [Longimicrobium terrae]|uniref:DUF6924 domain-containing protein n=1 Tax=Longimicrobium terrae TaxID=1639882 RepID=A0A841GUS4_9BACT|nr:hypothetical protein [Longimicrobium terrae]MBB4634277.1 hypothetical protein [Longimicrobium terrae]MBB6068833.1 hypothetical protein [Longimicrobium terrae]NNC28015.1 hypothetical protein [Longimicrobium terrae]
MKNLPQTDDSLVVRTDFSNAAAWDAIRSAIDEPAGEFKAYVEWISDPGYDGLTPEQLRPFAPAGSGINYLFIVDQITITHPEHPVLVLDLSAEPGRTFRVVPSALADVENNLSIANMEFADFADSVEPDGIFRGFSQS